ncbi:hypothetical protein [Spirulina sp. 06S082]|uniref:hypothetical protein n=1 Tax=Spirulina sp. 06S082 TaxID=3110248 RepID=UPI002B201374|nr:hypothetical protein [Spirulina sp. 06S082]MEA5469725.1 hypothetical protein [Spirulina sp. 06S082]
MLKRQTSGPVSCPSCSKIVAVEVKTCPHCGRRNPGMWGYRRSLQQLGNDFGIVPILNVKRGLPLEPTGLTAR